ncbi:hypothetical protein F5Y00DRAFT_178613 [Daldinia vernicosa]|uniref:uncharacterized protein n=1 Tax=Daldinia vernicosa TaxID=114800 RepID=UPI0020086713|nr:uncharacterized protein F5Y00DRAFT_178613 [Daldinia vernicosa]KAI0852709.1 hypothetical protein F5Y00DRAFT_178613 [Daldinia vernicosa]
MLLRQLHRPSSRPVALAAWRLSHTALLHGSTTTSRPYPPPSSSSSSTSSQTNSDNNSNSQDDAPKPRRPSLFEQLFPDEAKALGKNTTPKPSWASHLLDDPPQPSLDTDTDTDNDGDRKSSDVPLRAKSMLILSAASKHLAESDFLRLGPQGAHIEDWVGGISRVIQARDPDTLQPLGHYFVLFDREAAAAAYCDEVERLWQLGKAHVPGAHHKKKGSTPSVPPPPGLPSADGSGRDVAADLRAFTLVPPSQRYYLDVSSGFSRVRIEELDIGGVAFVDRLADRAGSKHMVLVSVDGGRISLDWLRQAIEEDGKDRNLPWRVTDLENGILPFGKSIIKQQDKDANDFEQVLRDQAARVTGSDDGVEGEGNVEGEEEVIKSKQSSIVNDGGYRRYPRFIIPFTDNAEAHRFVRYWHRRQFKIRMDLGGDKPAIWDETRILNTSVLW